MSDAETAQLDAKVTRGALWAILQQLGVRTCSFVVFAVLARLLEPPDFGLVAMAAVVITFLELLVEQGLGSAITQRKELSPEHLDAAFWISLLFSVLLAGALIAASDLVGDAFHEPRVGEIARWLSPVLIIRGLSSVHDGLLRRRFSFRALAARSIIAAVVGGVGGVVAAVMDMGAWALVVQQLVTATAGVIVLWGTSPWRPSFRFSRAHASELFGVSGYLLGAGVLDVVNRKGDDVLIGHYLGSGPLGVYAVAYRVLLIMGQVITSSMSMVAMSAFARLQQDHARLRQALLQSIRYGSLLAFPAFLGVAALSPELVEVLFGAQWSASAPILRALVFVGLLQSVTYYFGATYIALGRTDLRLKLLVVHTIANVTLFFLTVSHGIVAVALAYTLRGYALLPLDLFALRKLIDLDPQDVFRQLAPAAISTGIMCAAVGGLLVSGLALPPAAMLGLAIFVGAVAYVIALVVLFPSTVHAVREVIAQRRRRK